MDVCRYICNEVKAQNKNEEERKRVCSARPYETEKYLELKQFFRGLPSPDSLPLLDIRDFIRSAVAPLRPDIGSIDYAIFTLRATSPVTLMILWRETKVCQMLGNTALRGNPRSAYQL